MSSYVGRHDDRITTRKEPAVGLIRHTATDPPAPRQTGPAVWRGADLARTPERWTWALDAHEVDELVAAVDAFDGPLEMLTADRFPLPGLGPRLTALRHELTHGLGFRLVSGLPCHQLTERQAAAAFVGLGAHLGSARSQNARGELLGHVRNIGLDVADPNVRIYQTDRRQTFHTDSTDVVGLLCLETAARGGASMLASASTIYNEMLDRRPDLAAVLFRPIATDRRGEVPAGADPYFTIPVLSWHDQALTVLYQRQYIESAQRFDDVPPLAGDVTAALDLFDEIANEPDIHLEMQLAVGDMQFVHNHTLLHDRTAFVDKPGSPRHLLRLWLSVPGDRTLPPVFAQRYGSIEVGNRGGIVVGERDQF
ncbi:MAG: TauD/TfdA family dioxygenase [Ilumatobacter sp.]|uniref:TauD/TfdA family dioxygenase n=1 Tax=Ilumatobacter sp. TaxID=1967498 RepID=UPI00261D1BAC|nr:TauD/TfdA family dioxygenase [Ilumatobacter sp.]MDJ0769181.1 TauD/TfdA family dioxygenase [Ilumatobacter sp.]